MRQSLSLEVLSEPSVQHLSDNVVIEHPVRPCLLGIVLKQRDLVDQEDVSKRRARQTDELLAQA